MLLIFAPPSCFSGEANQEVELVYSGLHFLIPGGITAIGTNKVPNNFIGFRYGKKHSKKFLAFSEVDDYKKSKQECSETELLWSLIRDVGSPHVRKLCDHDAQQFKKMMLADSLDHGIWKGGDVSAYFIIAGDASPSSNVFLFSGKKIIQIGSSFMDVSSFRHVLSRYIIETNDEGGAFPPCDLIVGNVQSTDMTVAVEITGVTKEKTIKSDDGAAGYIAFRVAARTLMVYKGKIKGGDSISYGYFDGSGNQTAGNG